MANPQVADRLANYVPVNERLEQFYTDHEQGRVLTTVLEHSAENGFILMRAEIYRNQDDASPSATGHAFENRSEGYVNKTSYIENCETSAVGRALALLGYEIKRGIASREEMQKVDRMTQPQGERAPVQAINPTVERNTLLKGAMDARKLIADRQGFLTGGDFTPADLNSMANQMFAVTTGTEHLDIPQLRSLLEELSKKLVAMRMTEPSAQPDAPWDGPPKCECGINRERKKGVAKQGKNKGKPWAAWMCANRNDACEPIWIDLEAEDSEDYS